MNRELFVDILNKEMDVAIGCTEPASVALCAAYARSVLQGNVTQITVYASVNIIKNAMAAGIPGTEMTGVACAAAVGAMCADTSHGLQIMDHALKDDIDKAQKLINRGNVNVYVKKNVDKLYTETVIRDESGNTGIAVISETHTHLSCLKLNNDIVFEENTTRQDRCEKDADGSDWFSISSICEYIESVTMKEPGLEIIRNAIDINWNIAKKGMKNQFNLHVGPSIQSMQDKEYIGSGLSETAMKMTAAGIDARMGGAKLPVVTNSGSGNQGITATVPVLCAAEYLKASKETTFKAVTLSHLMAIYIHYNFGMLSALCGATIAGTAAACGITYLMGGSPKQIGYTVNNMLGMTAGMLCDGAKPDCALKVSACVNAAFLCSFMAMENNYVKPNEGIVEEEPDRTVDNFVRLGNDGSDALDNIILDIMLQKEKVSDFQRINR